MTFKHILSTFKTKTDSYFFSSSLSMIKQFHVFLMYHKTIKRSQKNNVFIFWTTFLKFEPAWDIASHLGLWKGLDFLFLCHFCVLDALHDIIKLHHYSSSNHLSRENHERKNKPEKINEPVGGLKQFMAVLKMWSKQIIVTGSKWVIVNS